MGANHREYAERGRSRDVGKVRRALWPLTFFAYLGLYFGWVLRVPFDQDFATLFRVSWVLVFAFLLSALQFVWTRDRWIEAITTFEGVTVIATSWDLWQGARSLVWFMNALLCLGVLYYLTKPTRIVAAVVVLTAGIAPASLAVCAAHGEIGRGGLVLMWVQIIYGLLALAGLCIAVKRRTPGIAGTDYLFVADRKRWI